MPNFLWGSFASHSIYRTPAKSLSIISGFIKYLIELLSGRSVENETPAKRIFREQFKTPSNARSSKRFVIQSAFWGHGNTYWEPRLGKRDTTSFYRFMQDNIKRLWGPDGQNIGVRALIGRWDPLGKDEVIRQWTEHLSQLHGNVRLFENAGHFIEELKYKEIAESITKVSKL